MNHTPSELTPDALAAYTAQRERITAVNERAREECERVRREECDVVSECKPTGNAAKGRSGIGMPATLYLQEFGAVVSAAFDGETAYQVGSSLTGATWRDVDVRIMLTPERYAAMSLGDPERQHLNAKWCALVMAFSELGRKMTGLPIDFQIQDSDKANREHPYPRSALITTRLQRRVRREVKEQPELGLEERKADE